MSTRAILLVEEDDDLRRSCRTSLTLAGYDVVATAEGLDALRRLEHFRPDLIVLDTALCDISGQAFRQELDAHEHTRDIPLVLLTEPAFLAQHGAGRARFVLLKPVSPDQLVLTALASIRSAATDPAV